MIKLTFFQVSPASLLTNTPGCPLSDDPKTPVATIKPGAEAELRIGTVLVNGYKYMNF